MVSDPRPSLDITRKRFAHFWARYPKKRSKGDAWRRFLKIRPDGATFRQIMDGLERAKDRKSVV